MRRSCCLHNLGETLSKSSDDTSATASPVVWPLPCRQEPSQRYTFGRFDGCEHPRLTGRDKLGSAEKYRIALRDGRNPVKSSNLGEVAMNTSKSWADPGLCVRGARGSCLAQVGWRLVSCRSGRCCGPSFWLFGVRLV